MKKLRFIVLIALAMVMAACLFACDNSAQTPGTSSGGSQNSSSAEPTESVKSISDFDDITAQTEYNVVYNLNYEGSSPIVTKVAAGGTANRPADPSRTGRFTFDDWYKDKDCTEKYNFTTKVNSNVILFAGWVSGTVTVSFNYNYVGAPAVERREIDKGSKVTAPANPTRDKYSFDGWFTEANGGTIFDFNSDVEASVTLFAHWTMTDATVTFKYNYTGAPADYVTTVTIGQKLTAPTSLPSRTEYDFDVWKTEGGEAYDFNSNVTGDLTLYGSWKLKKYTVTFDGNGYAAANSSQVVEHGGSVTDPKIDRSGYVCIWKLNGETFNFTTYQVTGPITLVATWEAATGQGVTATYHYNYTGAPNGGIYYTDNMSYGSTVFSPDDDPVRTGENFLFMGWYTDPECTTQYQFGTALLSNIDLYAKWYKRDTFEAEYIDLTNKRGFGFSVEYFETAMIQKDDGTAHASNGYYLTGLYYEGAFIDFIINSDKDIDDAVLVMRIQTEYDDKTFNPDIFGIYVNGAEDPLYYDEVSYETDISRDSTGPSRNEFEDVFMIDSLELKEGRNVITLRTTNDIFRSGTRQGDAPMIDCIYIYSNANLTWDAKTSNLEELNKD